MIDRTMIYSILYALAAKDGRQDALFGPYAGLAAQAFGRSVVNDAFPEVWFEVPLAGNPWFDLHVLTSREDVEGGPVFPPDAETCHPEMFEWFASQPYGVRQLALSHDLKAGRADDPAVQLLVDTDNPGVPCSFLQAAGRPDAAVSYRAFANRIPDGWFACYMGVFPSRPEVGLRVECIPDKTLQQAYAADAALLEAHLRQTGFDWLGDTVVSRCQQLARFPFNLEFQFDVEPDGSAGHTLGASLRFACPPGDEAYQPFETNGYGGELMQLVESWWLADGRWRLLEDAAFAKDVRRQDDSTVIYNYPAFLKLRWKDGEPLDAKVYFQAGWDRR